MAAPVSERVARLEEAASGRDRVLEDLRVELRELRALVRGLTWTLAGVSAVSAAIGALAAVLATGGGP